MSSASWRPRLVPTIPLVALAMSIPLRSPLPAPTALHAQSRVGSPTSAGTGPAILTLREQAAVYNTWLKLRLDRILPQLMRQEGVDMWIVICRENHEDPVFFSLMPFTTMYASRTSMLVFSDAGGDTVERLTVARSGNRFYKSVWEPDKVDQWVRLGQIIKERNPKRIGINESDTSNYGDGLTASLKQRLMAAVPPGFGPRVQSAERLAIRWLERRSAEELEVYPQIVAIAHAIIADAFSNSVITPGVTTTDDVVWWMRERSRQLGLTNWFQPSVDIQRAKDSPHKDSPVIHKGDLLHCDFGITYVKLCTDTQQMAYVLKDDEADAPKGLKDAMAQGNRLQDIHLAEMKTGRTGNEILSSALARAKGEGLTPSIYTHPLGVHGHAAGPTIGLWDKQDGVPGWGDFRLYEDTVHSIELNVRATVPEWGNQEVRIALEQDAAFTRHGASFIHERPTALRLIR
jgi:Xaa-Pro aminopeptidase